MPNWERNDVKKLQKFKLQKKEKKRKENVSSMQNSEDILILLVLQAYF